MMRLPCLVAAALAALAALSAPARADQLLGQGRIDSDSRVVLPGGPTLGLWRGHTFTATPDVLQIQGTGSTGDVSSMSVTPPGRGVASALSRLFDATVSLAGFGAKDDNATDNTAAVQAAVNAATAAGRTLRVSPSTGGTGVYRVGPGIDWKTVNLDFDEGAGFANLDGSPYSGSFYKAADGTAFLNLPKLLDPFRAAVGRRITSPVGDTVFLSQPGTRKKNDVIYNGLAPYPYSVTEGEQSYFLGGQSAPSSGSYAGKTIYANLYNYSNGPGVILTCDAVTHSQYLGHCTPSPTAIDPASPVKAANVFHPARITMVSGAGVPDNTFVGSWDAGTLAMAAGADNHNVGFTGPNGRYKFRVVSGRSEFNPLSLSVAPIGTAATGGPQGGMNYYNESTLRTAISTNAADQEGFLASWLASVTKTTPGNLRDRLHNGSAGIAVAIRPDDLTNAARSYPVSDGVVVTGWSGQMPDVAAGGQAAGATYGALNGLRIGGGCTSVYCLSTSRSLFQTGVNIQDYETGLRIENPAPSATGTAIYTAPGAGNVDIRDNLFVRLHVFETTASTPASSSAPCTTGQHAWDKNYEYRCVATNTWKRAALSSW